MRSSKQLKAPQRLRRIYDLLGNAYGPQHWWPAKTAFEVVLGAYLTQNTTWKAVEISLKNLRDAGALTIDGLRALTLEDLRNLIRPSGFYTRKAPALKAFISMLDEEFGGSLDALASTPAAALRKRLLLLPGVGPETADAILLYALKHPVPVADEYLRRIAERHLLIDLSPGRNRQGYESLAQLTRKAFASESTGDQVQVFNEFHALIVAVGKAHCGKSPSCDECPLRADLPTTRPKKSGI